MSKLPLNEIKIDKSFVFSRPLALEEFARFVTGEPFAPPQAASPSAAA